MPRLAGDPRTEPLPLRIDEAGLGQWVQSAPTSAEAWDRLGMDPTAYNPEDRERLVQAAERLVTISDAIGTGLGFFGDLPADQDPPVAWVDRMVELHLEELEGYWALDDLAYEGVQAGGWTVVPTVPPDAPATRYATRARWQAAHLAPRTPKLWFDKLLSIFSNVPETSDVGDVEIAKANGRTLVAEAARYRFTHWKTERRS